MLTLNNPNHHNRLADVGYNVGLRLAELVPWKEKAVKRETRLLRILYFISNTTWKYLFGKDAVLERSTEKEDQCTCYIITHVKHPLKQILFVQTRLHPVLTS